jgi:hypothetical protein
MKVSGLVAGLAVALLGAISAAPAFAQEKPGNVTLIAQLTPKPGVRQQFQHGLKELAAWRASVKEPQSDVVFEQITGDQAGSYLSVKRRMHWADLDNPVPSDEQAEAEYAKAMGDTLANYAVRVYKEVPDLDHEILNHPAKYYEIDTFHVPLGKQDRFAVALSRFREAIEKTKLPVDFTCVVLAEGGQFGTWIVAFGHDTSADFGGPSPDEILAKAFGSAEANTIVNEVSALSGGTFTQEVIEFRPDLSYLPEK